MMNQISIVKEAAILFGTRKVHAMHDSTEGGIIGGVCEMALASNLGFKLQESSIEVAKETASICRCLKINPSKLLGSGCLLASIKPDSIDLVIEELEKKNIRGTVIGKFGGERKEIIKNNGSVEEVQSIVVDELWRLLQH
jgi:hydrogenase maturation factor